MAIKRIRESEEMYLETILLLRGKKAEVHSIDVAEELGYVKSSVSRGVNLLKARGYIEIAPSGAITFTKAGKEKAEGIYERHRVLTQALLKLGADRETAENDACRIEHVISDRFVCVIQRIYRRISLYKKGELRKSAVSFFKIFFIGIKKS